MAEESVTEMDLNGISARIEKITPRKAAAMLAESAKIGGENRKLRPGVVGRYASDMANGNWGFSDSALCQREDGFFINGQHRLNAIVASDTSQRFVVVRGLPADAIVDMDRGVIRSVTDAINLSGGAQRKVGNLDVAIVRGVMTSGPCPMKNVTHHDVAKKMQEWADGVMFLLDAVHNRVLKFVTRAPVFAPVLRAYLAGYNKDRLREFIEVMITGESNRGKGDRAAIKLRTWLMTQTSGTGGTGGFAHIYPRASNALAAFLRMEALSRLFPASGELFPINKEEEALAGGTSRTELLRRKTKEAK